MSCEHSALATNNSQCTQCGPKVLGLIFFKIEKT